MKKLIICLILIAAHSIEINGQSLEEKQIDSFIVNVLNEVNEIPGLSVTVVKNETPFFTKSYGYSDTENKILSSTETAYYIASVTKSFVGLLAAKLEVQDVIQLDRPITEYRPIKNFKDKSVFEGITLNDLLSHSSGIQNNFLSWKFASIGDYDYDSMVKLLENKTSELRSRDFRYDNFGYNVFDIILHEELDMSWKDLLDKEIFTPLGMRRTSAYLSKPRQKKWNLAIPYSGINDERLPKEVFTQKNDETFQAAGGLVSSTGDMEKILQLFINQGKVDGKQIINKKVIEKSLTPIAQITKGRKDIFTRDAYAPGWNIGHYGDIEVYSHFGSFDGFFSHLSFLPNEKIGVAVLVNENHFGDNVGNLIASFVYDLLLRKVNKVSDYLVQYDKVRQRISQIQRSFANGRLSRANRKWLLRHNFKNYEGVYSNIHLGNLLINFENDTLIANLGISKAIATPSTNDETIRVEFTNGLGREILFVSDEDGTMAAVYRGQVFLKQK